MERVFQLEIDEELIQHLATRLSPTEGEAYQGMSLACLSSSDALGWMAREGCGLAVRLGDQDDPTRAWFIDADTVASLARGDSD